MRLAIVFLFGLTLMASCKKDAVPQKEVTVEEKFQRVIGKLLVQDSFIVREPGKVTIEIRGRGQGDMRLKDDGTVDSQGGLYYWEFSRPDTLFSWQPGDSKSLDRYHIVKMPADVHVVLIEKLSATRTHEFHYTAE